MNLRESRLDEPQGLRLVVRGRVQGVGFRPFVHRLASELELAGWVRNDGGGVTIEARGPRAALDAFVARLRSDAPPASRIATIEAEPQRAARASAGFVIRASAAGAIRTSVGPDGALCDRCLAELFDPGNRRYRHALIACTDCGPRYTIARTLPFDRRTTSMAGFALCASCATEYRTPGDRRFHAQTQACPACGPQLALRDTTGRALAGDPIEAAVSRLRAGEILAVKATGGYHLMCDARNAAAVGRLRARKQREAKPFALLAANARSIEPFAHVPERARRLLAAEERPIVLLAKRARADRELPGVAPDLGEIGVMLPSTPLQYLLFHEAAGRPHGSAWLREPQPLVLVATSANRSGDPIVAADDEALATLAGIADALLAHERPIVTRADDSVIRLAGERPVFVRRSRGHVPAPIALGRAGPDVVALGGALKTAICALRGDEAFLSQHVGDLDSAASRRVLAETLRRLLELLALRPAAIAHDAHPDFYSTRLAAEEAAQRGVSAIAVWHHHAHVAAVLAEHRVSERVLGLALDGTGHGADGSAWGGELLIADLAKSRRVGHLRALPLPGGDRAARAPWRMAAAVLAALDRGEEIARRFDDPHAGALQRLLASGANMPITSSAGRWFDAAAALLRIATVNRYEGEAAMRLEAAAAKHGPVAAMEGGCVVRDDGVIDPLPLLASLADLHDPARGAALFHATLAKGLAEAAVRAAAHAGVTTVALAGGCVINALLRDALAARLERAGLRVLVPQTVPANDGGLALGQAVIARALLERTR